MRPKNRSLLDLAGMLKESERSTTKARIEDMKIGA